ncbi:alkaline phosphatase family protein [Calditrichota bacterium]
MTISVKADGDVTKGIKQKLLFVGIDSADPDYIDRRIAEGALPNIASFKKDGAWGKMRSTFPVLSSAAWSTISTGLPPEKHGIYEFFRRKPGTWQDEPVHGGMKKGDDFWQICAAKGYKTVVINMPITYPPKPVNNGIIVSGMDTPGEGVEFTYPKEVRDELLREVPGYRIEQTAAQFDTVEHFLEASSQMMKDRLEAALYLFNKHNPDLAVVIFTALDRVLHALWKYVDPAHPAYNYPEAEKWRKKVDVLYDEVDQHLGKLMEWAGSDTTTIICSDHGSGAVHGVFFLNRWLMREGYLALKGLAGKSLAMKTGVQLQNWVKRNVPRPVKNIFNKFAPQLYSNIETRHGLSLIEPSLTLVYSWRKTDVMRLNLSGREPGGIVILGKEAENIQIEMKRKLENLTDARAEFSGYKPIRKVWTRKEAYPLSDELDDCPDLVIEWNDRLYSVDTTLDNPDGQLFITEEKPDKPWREEINGDHALHGIFGAKGKKINPGSNLGIIEILAVAPSVLNMLGIAKNNEMPGVVPQEMLNKELVTTMLVQEVPDDKIESKEKQDQVSDVYTDEERKIIEKRLRDLGYM